jgi:hypothetical protein
MSETAARATTDHRSTASAVRNERRTERALAGGFLMTVVALYAAVGWAIYAALGAIL